MNEYNHHRIIERFAHSIGLDPSKKETLIKASDFSDFAISKTNTAKSQYYYYRNYYNICVKGNTITLDRVKKNGFGVFNNSIQSMKNAGEKSSGGPLNWDPDNDEKEFFSAVNGRKKSSHIDLLDVANQSDNVSFLHAMGALGEDEKKSMAEFEEHLKKCFSEYLFLKNEEDALFMLGIAMHGIMDSFTPSHTGFQKYSEQSMALHAQGDVIPIKGEFDEDGKLKGLPNTEETVSFNPGQFNKEGAAKALDKYIKGFNGDDRINNFEYEMLRIFLIIADITITSKDKDNKVTTDEEGNPDEAKISSFMNQNLKGKTLDEINQFLKNYKYGERAYIYSETAINVITKIYESLSYGRNHRIKNYEDFKGKNRKNEEVDIAIKIWSNNYEKLHNDNNFKAKHKLLYDLFRQQDEYTTEVKKLLDKGQIQDALELVMRQMAADQSSLSSRILINMMLSAMQK